MEQKEIERIKQGLINAIDKAPGNQILRDLEASILTVEKLRAELERMKDAYALSQNNLIAANLQNGEMRALLIRWNEAWKVAAIVDSGHTHTDVALINAQTELFLEATATEKPVEVCQNCLRNIRCDVHPPVFEKRNDEGDAK